MRARCVASSSIPAIRRSSTRSRLFSRALRARAGCGDDIFAPHFTQHQQIAGIDRHPDPQDLATGAPDGARNDVGFIGHRRSAENDDEIAGAANLCNGCRKRLVMMCDALLRDHRAAIAGYALVHKLQRPVENRFADRGRGATG